MAEMTVDGRDLTQSITLRVRMPFAFGLRIWFACKLLDLAATISGIAMVIEMDDEDEEPIEASGILTELLREAASD